MDGQSFQENPMECKTEVSQWKAVMTSTPLLWDNRMDVIWFYLNFLCFSLTFTQFLEISAHFLYKFIIFSVELNELYNPNYTLGQHEAFED